MTWLMIAAKAVHILSLMLWCAGLILLPLAMAQHEQGADQHRFNRVRLLTHIAYTQIVTPAAVVAVGSGMALIFLREVFGVWFALKLVMVSVLVALHTVIGHQVAQIAEHRERYASSRGGLLIAGNLVVMTAILVIVLLKPPLSGDAMPAWLTRPYGGGLWFDDPS